MSLPSKGLTVTGLLICAVPEILLMAKCLDAQLAGQGDCLIRAGIIHEDYVIHDFSRDVLVGLLKCLLRPVRGQNDGYALAIQHKLHPMKWSQ